MTQMLTDKVIALPYDGVIDVLISYIESMYPLPVNQWIYDADLGFPVDEAGNMLFNVTIVTEEDDPSGGNEDNVITLESVMRR